MIKWRIYYDNGDTFDSDNGSPEDAPSFGVICIVQPNELCGRTVTHGYDWYYYRTDIEEWWQSCLHGLLDGLLHNHPICAVKQGRNAPDNVYRSIIRAATEDKDFPVKSGKIRGEHP